MHPRFPRAAVQKMVGAGLYFNCAKPVDGGVENTHACAAPVGRSTYTYARKAPMTCIPHNVTMESIPTANNSHTVIDVEKGG